MNGKSKKFFMLDEAIFSASQATVTTWMNPGEPLTNECKNKLSFTAVAALGIINTDGEIVSVSTEPKAFDRDDFLAALK